MKTGKWMEAGGGWGTVEIPYRCGGCPYKSPGFICSGKDGSCMRTKVEEMNRRSRKQKNRYNQRKSANKKSSPKMKKMKGSRMN